MSSPCPFAVQKMLGPQTQARMRAHDIVCLHTMVGYLRSTDTYFRTGNGYGFAGTESHYGVGGVWGSDAGYGLDGALWQWQARGYMADANGQGNPRVISIETADSARAPIVAWTAAQCETIARVLAWESSPAAHAQCPTGWACRAVGIPLVLIPDTLPGRRGIGYHRQGVDPWRVPGGEYWSQSYGKVCPDSARIAQIPGIIARARVLAAGGAPGPVVVGPTEADERVQRILSTLLRPAGGVYYVGDIDGIAGPVQRAAVTAFQTDAGITVTGVWDASTEAHYRGHEMVTQADRDAITRGTLDALRPLLDDIAGAARAAHADASTAAQLAAGAVDLARATLGTLRLADERERERVGDVLRRLDDVQARMPRVNTRRYDRTDVPTYDALEAIVRERGTTYEELSGALDGVSATVGDDQLGRVVDAVREVGRQQRGTLVGSIEMRAE